MTYLIQNKVAHFYNRENVEVSFPNSKTIYTNEHSIHLLKRNDVEKVIDKPFRLNNVFIK